MGRWAQAKRRGGRPGYQGGPGPPPAPTMDTAGGYLNWYNTGSDNTGGTMTLYRGSYDVGPWEVYDTRAWAVNGQWMPVVELDPGWYVCSSTGNGSVYVGESSLSNAINV